MRRIAALIVLATLSACADKGPDLAGDWKSDRSTFRVTQQGETYTVVVKNPNGMLTGTYAGPWKDGAIQVKGPLAPLCPEIRYAKESGKLLFCGEEFVRTSK